MGTFVFPYLFNKFISILNTLRVVVFFLACLSLQQVYIRGSQIRLIIFPDMLRHSPMFRMLASKNKNRSLGLAGQKKTMAMRARAGTAMMRGGRGRGRPGGDR